MPVAKDYEKPIVPNPPSRETSVTDKESRINTSAYKSAVVQSKVTPLDSLITHISGSLWAGGVTWYSQLLGKDEEPTAFDINLPPIYQQYRKITEVQVKVTSPLQYTQIQETNDPELTGASITLGGFIPNEGDMFLADVGSGREGIFVVNKTPVRKNILAETIFEFEYTFVAFSDANQRYIDVINNRVIKTEVYSAPTNGRPSYTLMSPESVGLRKELIELRKEVIYSFHDGYYNPERNTYLDPDGNYDGNLVSFVKSLISPRELPSIIDIDTFRIGEYFPSRKDLVWKVLLTGQWRYISNIVQKAVLVKSGDISSNVRGTIASHNDITYSVVPDVGQYNGAGIGLQYTFPIWDVVVENQISHNPTLTRPLIKPVEYDEFYILSRQFYTKEIDGMSELEYLLYLFLNKLPVDNNKVAEVYNAYTTLSNMSRFYYAPIIIVLLNYAIASI